MAGQKNTSLKKSPDPDAEAGRATEVAGTAMPAQPAGTALPAP